MSQKVVLRINQPSENVGGSVPASGSNDVISTSGGVTHARFLLNPDH